MSIQSLSLSLELKLLTWQKKKKKFVATSSKTIFSFKFFAISNVSNIFSDESRKNKTWNIIHQKLKKFSENSVQKKKIYIYIYISHAFRISDSSLKIKFTKNTLKFHSPLKDQTTQIKQLRLKKTWSQNNKDYLITQPYVFDF